MLKWTVLPRRESDVLPRPLPSTSVSTPRKTKRRRSSTSRRSSVKKRNDDDLEADKENRYSDGENHFFRSRLAWGTESSQTKEEEVHLKRQFTSSTPIKSSENVAASGKRPKNKEEDTFWRFDALRDVSNLTPHNDRGVVLKKKCKSEPKRYDKLQQKKKKDCLNLHHSESDNYFKPFEAVDSHIESVLAEKLCSCKKLDVKKHVQISDLSPPTKKLKTTDNFDDFLRRISLLTSPKDQVQLPGLRLTQNNVNFFQKEVQTMSPLVRKFLDLKFEKNRHNDSSLINNMSLDKIVDAILEKSASVNTSMIVNLEENLVNHQNSMSDSGFKSTNSHQIDENLNNNVSEKQFILLPELLPLDKTVIPINVTFNERYVGDDDVSTRKRPSSSPVFHEATESKRANLDNPSDNCTLKRQKCVRRRKTFSCKNFSPFWSSSKKFATICDDSFDNFDNLELENIENNTPLRGCYLENKEILRDETFIIDTPSKGSTGIRRCLLFESPKINESESLSESIGSTVDVKGSMDLKIFAEDDSIVVNVIRCKDLYRPNGEHVNAYVKVAIADRLSKIRKNKNALLQRTTVQSNSTRPFFNHTFKFSKNAAQEHQKRIHIEVWHRDRILKSSEFLGCMSFDVRDAFGKGINGSYRLLSQSTGRSSNVPITYDLCRLLDNEKMGESQTGSVEEVISLDDLENDLKRSTTKAALIEQQKYADENLFLRYLELDPTEGPDAIPAATQRKATGNKSGRTPFTQTKRLVRPTGNSGFGFSVVWTHPPRIERVEKGLPADKAGILPGDYIIFVDKHNVVMMPEIDILNLIRSYGSQLTLEIFRRNPSRNGSVPSVRKIISSTLATSSSIKNDSNTNIPGATNNISSPITTVNIQGASNMLVPRRPSSTACSTNTVSADYNRKKLHLPQVTFTAEKIATTPEENRKKAMYQLITKEQQYATAMQFAITRFVSALAERRDLISQSEHAILFQNCEEILRITEEILEHLINEDGEPQIQLLVRMYRLKCHEITTAYKKYCSGIKKADCVLANKMKNQNSDFVRFIQIPVIPRRRPDITTFIHKPLSHYREILKLLLVIQSHTKANHDDYQAINQVIHELQVTYRVITSEAGLMEPGGEGRLLLSVQDLENRLVFTKCKPFVLNKPGRQWIFGGDLSRVEGRNVRQYWALLFSDLLLFAKVSRDRVLFIIEDPLPLTHITDMFFNVRKKDTEFRIIIHPEGNKAATSPTVHCGPDLSRTPRKNAGKKTVILRAPNAELKAVWQNLLQRQIFHLTSFGTDGSSLSSPNLESPEVPITSSVVTLQSAETNHHHQPPNIVNKNVNQEKIQKHEKEIQKQLDALIEHKCKQLSKNNINSKCNAIHLEQWMKGQLDTEPCSTPEMETLTEEWTHEMLRKRSEELQLIDSQGNVTTPVEFKRNESRCEDVVLSDQSPSRSTTTESQVTVRSSPIVPETVPVCRQCHKNCLSNGGNAKYSNSLNNENNQIVDFENGENVERSREDDWQPLVLLGLCASNPIASLVKLDPFSMPVPNILVKPATPEQSIQNNTEENCINCQNELAKLELKENPPSINDISPDDSPQTEEHPYHSLSSSALTLRRFGTMSSLERCGSEEKEDQLYENHSSSNEDEENAENEIGDEEPLGIDNQAFVHTPSSIMHWTVKAGSFVAEKMAFFEKFGEDYRSGTSFFDRYLKTTEINHINGDELQEEETSGATSGEEIWGTPTSGGDLDDSVYSPSYEGKLSPNDGSISSDYNDDTEMMMDELLMTPPISAAAIRGLLPRRTLEPLIEEDCSETSTSSTSSSVSEAGSKSESSVGKGNETGNAADECSRNVAAKNDNMRGLSNGVLHPQAENIDSAIEGGTATTMAVPRHQQTTEAESLVVTKIHRSESYRHIIEDAERESEEKEEDTFFFNRFKPAAKFVNIEQVPRSKSIKIFEFFNVRRSERRIYETFPENRHLLKVFNKENALEELNTPFTHKLMSTKKLKDKQMDRRFWKQLSRRRGLKSD